MRLLLVALFVVVLASAQMMMPIVGGTPSAVAWGAPPVQSGTSGGTGGSTFNDHTFTQPVTAGNVMVMAIYNATNDTVTVTSIIFNGSCGTFVLAPRGRQDGGSRSLWMYYAYVTATCTGVEVDFSGSINSIVSYTEYSGLAAASVLDCDMSGTGTGTSITSGTCATGTSNTVLVGALFVTTSGGGTLTAGTSFTLRVNNNSTSHRGLEDRNVTSTGSYAATGTYSSSQTWLAYVLALKKA